MSCSSVRHFPSLSCICGGQVFHQLVSFLAVIFLHVIFDVLALLFNPVHLRFFHASGIVGSYEMMLKRRVAVESGIPPVEGQGSRDKVTCQVAPPGG